MMRPNAQACLSNILSIRFDFGVPLEDIFPPDDIHPRLKYLFTKAFEAYIKDGLDVRYILRHSQGTLNERLMLKDRLVVHLDYHLNASDFPSGTYFWLIRHFLGLLPLPLLPTHAKGVEFDWKMAADECKHLFRCRDSQKRDYLDYDIAQTLNMLPLENFTLLAVIIGFLRKLLLREVGCKASLMALSNYYCSSLFVRPYRPGFCKTKEYRPLLLYLIVRWQNISQHCRSISHPTYFLESDLKGDGVFCLKNTSTQTNLFFDPDIITICKKIPYLNCVCKKYFIDGACQTESDLSKPNVQEAEQVGKKCSDVYKLTYIEEIEEDSKYVKSREDLNEDNTLFQTAVDYSFTSRLDDEDKRDWQRIVRETMETVRKVEESYIYDDYDTFQGEDFNQVAKNSTSKIRKYGFGSNSASKPPIKASSTPKQDSPESENSYIKYPDVCSSSDASECEDVIVEKNRDSDEIKVTDHRKVAIGQILFQSSSPASEEGEDSAQHLQDDDPSKYKKKRRSLLNRISLDVLRMMTPKKSAFKKIETKVRYRRIRNDKCHTI